ncbi:hypothetical protein NDU88_003976 [Pleurodeles waltl]|uniref:Uncharacterized protein n=1 Tax=Pleurodeles waltl TaxID=8319 RepID=A0AAV7VEU9_PLEWA|nr:hypothetical protein NDU88_003976 [Pleurodeles waltl]
MQWESSSEEEEQEMSKDKSCTWKDRKPDFFFKEDKASAINRLNFSSLATLAFLEGGKENNPTPEEEEESE